MSIEIKIKIFSFSGKEEEITLGLKSKKISKEKITEQLLNEIIELKNKVSFLEKENKNKELEIKKLDRLKKLKKLINFGSIIKGRYY